MRLGSIGRMPVEGCRVSRVLMVEEPGNPRGGAILIRVELPMKGPAFVGVEYRGRVSHEFKVAVLELVEKLQDWDGVTEDDSVVLHG